jgi:heptosyltransferase-2
MIAFATGAKTRSIHFHGHQDRNRYSTVPVPGKGILKPIIERDMDTVRALGMRVSEGKLPMLHSSASEIRWAKSYANAFTSQGPLLALGLGASRPTKSWPVERFAQVAVQWCKAQNGAAIAIASPQETALIRDFLKSVDEILSNCVLDAAERATLRNCITAESGFSVRELSALLGAASVYVGNDSGPKHVAVAQQTPTVTVFGPEHPFEWHPYPQSLHPYFFVENLPCRRDAQPGMPAWCGLDVCVEQRHQCMTLIGPEPILQKCIEIHRRTK